MAWLITETRVADRMNWSVVSEQVGQLRQAVSQKSIWLPTAFLFLWQAMPTGESAFFFFFTNELGFEPEFLGRVNLVTSLAALIGCLALPALSQDSAVSGYLRLVDRDFGGLGHDDAAAGNAHKPRLGH